MAGALDQVGAAIPCLVHHEIVGPAFCVPLELEQWRLAIYRLAESEVERDRQKEAARGCVEDWSWERAADLMVALLDELASGVSS